MKHKLYYLLNLAVIIVVLFFGVGYAQISSIALTVKGSASITGLTGLTITDIHYSTNQNADLIGSTIQSFSQTTMSSTVILSDTDGGSYISYEVTIMNLSDTDMYFDQIVYDPSFYNNSNIIVETDTNLQYGQLLAVRQTVTFHVLFKYSPDYLAGASTPYSNTLNSFINFHFIDVPPDTPPITYHTITYVGFEANSYPTSIESGSDLTVTFDDPVPTQITVTGASNYVYSNGVLNIPNVTSDITIVNTSGYDFPVIENNGQPVEIHAPNISSTNTIQVNDLLAKTFYGINHSTRTINRMTIAVTYTTTSGSKQSINIILHVNGQDYSQTIQFNGKQTNTTVTASFTGISIAPGEEFTISSTAANINNGSVTISDELVTCYFDS